MQTFGPIINPIKDKNKGSKITHIKSNNEIISDKLSMANCFNNYFVVLGTSYHLNLITQIITLSSTFQIVIFIVSF